MPLHLSQCLGFCASARPIRSITQRPPGEKATKNRHTRLTDRQGGMHLQPSIVAEAYASPSSMLRALSAGLRSRVPEGTITGDHDHPRPERATRCPRAFRWSKARIRSGRFHRSTRSRSPPGPRAGRGRRPECAATGTAAGPKAVRSRRPAGSHPRKQREVEPGRSRWQM